MSTLINEPVRHCPVCGERLSIDIWPAETLFICPYCDYYESYKNQESNDGN